jgi:dihydrofolate reductase
VSQPDRIEGTAIVSADGMIADAHGVQPQSLIIGADQRYFHDALRRASAVAHGRRSAEGGNEAKTRRRLILTRRVDGVARDPTNDNAVLWNPTEASLQQAWEALGLSGGLLMVIGGTDVYGLFLALGYDAFYLSRAGNARLPGGRPLFPQVPSLSPEALLSQHGLTPGPQVVLDRAADLTSVTWRRQ